MGDATRKPDISCWFPKHQFDWRHLATFAEVKNRGSKANEKLSYIEVAGKASCLLYAQDGRHAAPCIRILGSEIFLTIFDRGGSLTTCSYDIHRSPQSFLCILISISSASNVFGCDKSIHWQWEWWEARWLTLRSWNSRRTVSLTPSNSPSCFLFPTI